MSSPSTAIESKLQTTILNDDSDLSAEVNLQSLFYEHSPCMFFVTNADTKIIDCNDHMVHTLGYTKAELLAFNSCHDILSENSKRHFPSIRKKYRYAGQISHAEFQAIQKDGNILEVSISATAIKNLAGDIVYHLVVWDVITELVDARQIIDQQARKLQLKYAQLERRNSELNTFANIIIHDLKAPLRSINYFAESLDSHQYDLSHEDVHSPLVMMRAKIRQMSILLDDIYAYFFNTETDSVFENIDWTVFLDDIISSLPVPAGFDIQSYNVPTSLNIQKLPLQQVFVNIINNAIKYHHDVRYGRLNIFGSENKSHYFFQINDNGPGIVKNYLKYIFKPLSRLQASSMIEGSGLGLAIVDKIIQHHQGKITVRSSEDAGTTFYFSWAKN